MKLADILLTDTGILDKKPCQEGWQRYTQYKQNNGIRLDTVLHRLTNSDFLWAIRLAPEDDEIDTALVALLEPLYNKLVQHLGIYRIPMTFVEIENNPRRYALMLYAQCEERGYITETGYKHIIMQAFNNLL